MSYQSMFKPAPSFYPMPNTGTILDISAGDWLEGIHGQSILNGGVALFYGIAALPNMFKSTLAAAMGGCLLRAFPESTAHAHDTETTMQQTRVEYLMRDAMNLGIGTYNRPENLISSGRLFFTTSVDYDGTELFDIIKTFCKDRIKNDKQIALEILDPQTKKPYMYYNPVFEFWDSLSGLKTKDATEKAKDGDVGTKDLNMLAMNFNMGKSQIVDQAPDLTARHGVYLCFTAHVGQKYELDPRKPAARTLRWLKGDVKLKRVPENTTFNTGNFYVVVGMSQLADKGVDIFPRTPSEKDQKAVDLIELTLVNQRGKFGLSNNPLPLAISQRHGLRTALSNFLYLRQEGKYGIVGNDQNYALALTPDVKMRRTTVQQIFDTNFAVCRAAQILMEMRYMFTHDADKYAEYYCEPEDLYKELIAMGYDWNLLLNTRFWFGPVESKDKDVPYLSTMDLLKMRVGKYHPYWYPVKKEELVASKRE